MEEEATIEEFIVNIDRYCYKRDIAIRADSDGSDCVEKTVRLLKKHGIDVYYTSEPSAYVAARIGDKFVAFVDITCSDRDVEIGELWCWERVR